MDMLGYWCCSSPWSHVHGWFYCWQDLWTLWVSDESPTYWIYHWHWIILVPRSILTNKCMNLLAKLPWSLFLFILFLSLLPSKLLHISVETWILTCYFYRAAATLLDKLPYNQMVSPDLIERVRIINMGRGENRGRGYIICGVNTYIYAFRWLLMTSQPLVLLLSRTCMLIQWAWKALPSNSFDVSVAMLCLIFLMKRAKAKSRRVFTTSLTRQVFSFCDTNDDFFLLLR